MRSIGPGWRSCPSGTGVPSFRTRTLLLLVLVVVLYRSSGFNRGTSDVTELDRRFLRRGRAITPDVSGRVRRGEGLVELFRAPPSFFLDCHSQNPLTYVLVIISM